MSGGAAVADRWTLRLEVPVVALEGHERLLFGWLEAQSGLTPRALFFSRDGSSLVAGVGAAHVHSVREDPAATCRRHAESCWARGAALREGRGGPHRSPPAV